MIDGLIYTSEELLCLYKRFRLERDEKREMVGAPKDQFRLQKAIKVIRIA